MGVQIPFQISVFVDVEKFKFGLCWMNVPIHVISRWV